MADEVLLSIENGIGLITLNRPEALNTFDYGLMNGLGAAYKQCDQDDEVRCVVLTGAGRAFCAGADLSGGGDTFDSSEREDISSCPLSMQAWDVRKPVIAACNGHAVGVGMGIAAQCDIRIVANESKYGFLQNRRGVIADFGMTWALPRLVGFERAFDLLVRAPTMTGAEVLKMGLASRSLPAEQVLPAAMEMATDFAANCAPLISAMHKRLLWEGLSRDRHAAINKESVALNYSMNKPDALEGGVAYFEKRAPQWAGSVSSDWPEGF